MGNSKETSLYYYWKVIDCLARCFAKIPQNSLHYIWTFITHFAGVFLKIFYTPSLLLESFKLFVGVFLKKFIKFSHKMVSRFFQSPSIYVRKFSLHLCFFGGRFFYHIIAIIGSLRVKKSSSYRRYCNSLFGFNLSFLVIRIDYYKFYTIVDFK